MLRYFDKFETSAKCEWVVIEGREKLTVRIATKLNRKKMKNCEGSRLRPAKKYKIMLKQVAMANFTGISATMPAIASVNG